MRWTPSIVPTGNDQTVYFTAGPEDEENGLLGALNNVPEPATLSLAFGGLLAMAFRRRSRAVRTV